MGAIIGMDLAQRSATIEDRRARHVVLSTGRFRDDSVGYRDMLAEGRRFGERVRAVEGATASANTSRTARSTTARS
jgi:hypothetical protein